MDHAAPSDHKLTVDVGDLSGQRRYGNFAPPSSVAGGAAVGQRIARRRTREDFGVGAIPMWVRGEAPSPCGCREKRPGVSALAYYQR